MYDFWFEFSENSECEGEQFLVECDTLKMAYEILQQYNISKNEIKFLDRLSVEEGEWMGLDTY